MLGQSWACCAALDARAPLPCRDAHGAFVPTGRQEDAAREPASSSPSRREPGQAPPRRLTPRGGRVPPSRVVTMSPEHQFRHDRDLHPARGGCGSDTETMRWQERGAAALPVIQQPAELPLGTSHRREALCASALRCQAAKLMARGCRTHGSLLLAAGLAAPLPIPAHAGSPQGVSQLPSRILRR